MNCAMFSPSVPEFVLYWVSRNSQSVASRCLRMDVFLPLFCANWSLDAVKGASFHSVFIGPLGDRRQEKFNRTAFH